MKKLSWYCYRAACALMRRICPAPEFTGLENLPQGRPCIIVGNHAHTYGPVYSELYLPFPRAIWCIADMMDLKALPDYAFRDFWSHKPRWCRWFYRILSYIIAPICVPVLTNAHCVGVYKDYRVMTTLRKSIRHMEAGDHIVIFPEQDVPCNDIVWEFQEGFVDLAAMYARRTGEPVDFVPMYVAPKLKRVCFGKPVAFDPTASPEAERVRICHALTEAITDMARSLPIHRVVPYPNIPRRQYPLNRPTNPDEDLST